MASDAGTTAPGTGLVLRGPTGLAAFRRRVRCAVPDPEGFELRVREAGADAVRVADWRCSALSVELPRREGVVLAQVLAGALQVAAGADRFAAASGQLAVLGPGSTRALAVAAGTHLRTVRIADAAMPDDLRGDASATGITAASDVSGVLHEALRLLGEAMLIRPAPSMHLGDGLLAAALAVLDERRPRASAASLDLRRAVERHIELHLADPALTPQSLADAFGVSLRWVHQTFDRDGETLAKHIRSRRADAVAADLVAEPADGRGAASAAALAERHGLSGRDHLARVFRGRYGMSVPEFRDALRAGRVPRPLGAPPAPSGAEPRAGA